MDHFCVICGSNQSVISVRRPVDYEYSVIPPEKYCYLRCRDCCSEWLSPRPAPEALAAFYPESYHAYSEGEDHGWFAKILVGARAKVRGRKYRSLLSGDSGSLFDVGAGDCRHFYELARYADLKFSGVELQPALAKRAKEMGFDVATGTLESMDIMPHIGRHDIVSMNHVIEHVNDPVEVMRRVLVMLKPGGYVIGQLPTNEGWESHVFGEAWAGYHYPRHLQVFSRKGLRRMLEKLGYEDIQIRSSPHCQIAISMQNILLKWGVKLQLRHGRSNIYGLLLLLSLPFEFVIAAIDKSGIIDFTACKPKGN
jgi:SAM-dependent methyltransferase